MSPLAERHSVSACLVPPCASITSPPSVLSITRLQILLSALVSAHTYPSCLVKAAVRGLGTRSSPCPEPLSCLSLFGRATGSLHVPGWNLPHVPHLLLCSLCGEWLCPSPSFPDSAWASSQPPCPSPLSCSVLWPSISVFSNPLCTLGQLGAGVSSVTSLLPASYLKLSWSFLELGRRTHALSRLLGSLPYQLCLSLPFL